MQHDSRILLEKCPAPGIWGGLWSPPQIKGFVSEAQILQFCFTHFKSRIKKIMFGSVFRHTFSHFHLDVLPAYLTIQKQRFTPNVRQQIWYHLSQSQAIGLPAPINQLIKDLKGNISYDSLSAMQ